VITTLPADVKRAVSATLDRMRAERDVQTATEELTRTVDFERLCRQALEGDEEYAYSVALTNALQRQQDDEILRG
jgi:hypothetical protein